MTNDLPTCVPSPGEICPEPAKWYIWFEACGGLYGHVCDKHAADAVVNGVNGYRPVQLQSIVDERRRIAARDAKRAAEREIKDRVRNFVVRVIDEEIKVRC